MKTTNILNNKKDNKKYLSTIFTEKEYIKKEDKEYPFKLGIVLGIPFFHWAQEILSKKELLGKIKAYCQILGLEVFEFKDKREVTRTLELKSAYHGAKNGC